ncbi:MAG TPA: hypothetical protein VGC88_04015 [Terriglobales bacterium]
MIYLGPEDYEVYGLPATTSAAQVAAASAMIESFCRRPSLGVQQYTERLRFAPGASSVRLSFLPLATNTDGSANVTAAKARFAHPRKGECEALAWTAEVARAFGLPGQWANLTCSQFEATATGEISVFPSLLGLSFNEIEVTYMAGCDPVPEAVKFACAQVVRNAQAMPALSVKRSKVERLEMEYFGSSLIDDTVKALLKPFVAERLG